MDLGALGQGGVTNVKNFFNQPADKYGNDQNVEMQWAFKAYQHAEVYFNLITTVDPSILKLTPLDDEIYTDFRQRFKDFNIETLDEDSMKSTEGKAAWREFCDQYKGRVEDFNMGSLLRHDTHGEISEDNTMLVPRIQFLAIEIARNREGFNSELRAKYGIASKKQNTDNNDNAKSSEKESEAKIS